MGGPGRGWRTLGLAVVATTAVCATLPSAGSAEDAADLERRAEALREENAAMAAGSQSALVSLTRIESRLSQARAELAGLRARAARVAVRRRGVMEELAVARVSLRASRRALAERLRMLYEQAESDTLAVVLGSGSLSAALDTIETLDLAATQDEDLIASSRSASRRLAALEHILAARERELEQLAVARAAAAASLAAARSERLQKIAALRVARGANDARIATLEDRARSLASAEEATAASSIRALTVAATGYALPGHTASGSPVGWGAVAVDPGVIPLGARLSIPGYGVGVATDTGGAIRGARIDVWFPTVAQARAWGTRVVTITVYSS